MKSEYPFSPLKREEKDTPAPQSRFMDEKMADDTDAELKADSALKPAGLSNPFWN